MPAVGGGELGGAGVEHVVVAAPGDAGQGARPARAARLWASRAEAMTMSVEAPPSAASSDTAARPRRSPHTRADTSRGASTATSWTRNRSR